MTATIRKDERGRSVVRYHEGDYVGDYVALDEADARDFATNEARQRADRAFAVQQFRARVGL